MSVHYKFKSALEYDTVTFDGLHISVKDLKNAIIQQKRIGKNTDFDLQVTNAQTKEVYQDEDALIPKNTSLLIARIPLAANQIKSKPWEGYGGDSTPPTKTDEVGPIAKAVDLANLDVSEEDKIRAMMSQSTQDYDPSNYMKIRGANQMGAVPPNYRCYKCHQSGHWIKDCPLSQGPEPMEIKKSTGIPRSFMVPVEGPQVPGAMMTPNGSYAVPVLDHQAYTQKQQPAPPPIQESKPEIPEDLVCSICHDLLTDAVMIPCCGNSFCDECIRSCLLDSEEHECPDCHEKDISPGILIPNRYLRNSVLNFKNNTGYVKRLTYKANQTTTLPKDETSKDAVQEKKQPAVEAPKTATSEVQKKNLEEKTVISEADSTEPPKVANADCSEEADAKDKTRERKVSVIPEGPPGVSPRQSPKAHPITNMANVPRTVPSTRHGLKSGHPERSPRRPMHSHRSPNYTEPMSRNEDRPGTPTVDEPGVGSTSMGSNAMYPPSGNVYNAPPGVMPPMMGLPQPSVLQGPPPMPGPYPTGQPPPGVFPPSQAPPPNFRLPPPPTYMPSGPYNAPPRPVFDTSRPPGPIPSYPPGFPPHRPPRGRDYPGQPRGIRGRTPPGIIDDPLEAFNRMLREKDERERRMKQRKGRSYSRSSSRSFSRSPRRMRSRSPRRRMSRSRSRSFTISRSRSRSFSPVNKTSPMYREFSPRGSPRRRGHSRYRSPVRSPPRYRYKDPPRDREYERERAYPRDNRAYSRERGEFRERDIRDREADDFRYYDGYERDRLRTKGGWGQGQGRGHPDTYYPSHAAPLHPVPPYAQPNRYPPRDAYPPYAAKNEVPPAQHAPVVHPPQRRYEDVAPPGTEQPPIPGMEPSPRLEDRYQYERDKHVSPVKEKEDKVEERKEHSKHKHRASYTPEKETRSADHQDKRERRHESPDRHKRKKRDDSSEERHKRDASDDERSKKNKDKKKRKEKKEAEKKKRKEKKEKREKKAEEKEKKIKEEAKKPKVEEEKVEEGHVETKPEVEIKAEEVKIEAQPEIPVVEETKADLYGDILTEGIDTKVVESYGKIEEQPAEAEPPEKPKEETEISEETEVSKDEDSEKDILELHTNETELEKNEMLAPLPEKSKWELDEETPTTPAESAKNDPKWTDKTGKVTNEVLKRAENAIFAKAINAIRPIEIKKISNDRAKLYSGERKGDDYALQVTVSTGYEDDIEPPGTESKLQPAEVTEKPRVSVKERLGCKVDDLDRIVKVEKSFDRNRSLSLSPLSKRAMDMGRNYTQAERKVEIERRRHDERSRSRHVDSSRDRHGRGYNRSVTDRRREDYRRDKYSREGRRREEMKREEERRGRRQSSASRTRTVRETEQKKEKRKRSRSRSESRDRKSEKDKKKRKEKKQKKEKTKKHHKKEDEKEVESKVVKTEESQVKPKPTTDRRKPTLDEANFEPDYDLESESEKEEDKNKDVKKAAVTSSSESELDKKEEKKKAASSSSDSSDSTSDEDRKKKKKHKKHKKKSKKDSSSSSSDSESDSSEDEKDRKRKKHKKKQKKRKKSKRK